MGRVDSGEYAKRVEISTTRYAGVVKAELAETVKFEPTCGCPQTDFESFSKLVKRGRSGAKLRHPARKMQAWQGFLPFFPCGKQENRQIGSNRRFCRFWKELWKEQKNQRQYMDILRRQNHFFEVYCYV